MKTIQELQQRMRQVENEIQNAIESLQDEQVEVLSVNIEKTEVTCKDDIYPRYFYRVHIKTQIR